MSDEERKRQLALELTRARASMSRQTTAVRRSLDFPTRIKESVKGSPVVWVSGGVGVVLLVSVLVPCRRRREAPQNVWSGLASKYGPPRQAASVASRGAMVGIVLTAAKFLLPFVQPALMSFITRKVNSYVGGAEKTRAGK